MVLVTGDYKVDVVQTQVVCCERGSLLRQSGEQRGKKGTGGRRRRGGGSRAPDPEWYWPGQKFLQRTPRPDTAPDSERHQGHAQSSNAGSRRTRSSCWWLSNLFAAANSAQHAALPIGAWMRPSWKSDQKVCPRWSDGKGRGKGKGTVLGNGADADSLKQNSNPSGEASE